MRIAKILSIATAASTAGSLQKQAEAFISQVMLLVQGGITWEEAGQLIAALVELGVNAAQTLAEASGDEKKQAVLDVVSYLYDVIAPSIPLWGPLNLIRRFLKEPGRQIVLAIASGLVEVFVARLPQPNVPADPATLKVAA